MNQDIRSKKIIFIPFCLICQAFQAKGIVKKYPAIIKPVLEKLMVYNINLIQLPCPESQFGGYKNSLNRFPKSIKKYNNPKFRNLCHKLSLDTVDIIKAIIHNNYKIIAILGIEYSPSCAISYQYTEKGIVHKQGIFIEELKSLLNNEKIKIPFIGINRRGVKKSLHKLEELLSQYKQLTLI